MKVSYNEFYSPDACTSWLTSFGKKWNLSVMIIGITEDKGVIRVYYKDYSDDE